LAPLLVAVVAVAGSFVGEGHAQDKREETMPAKSKTDTRTKLPPPALDGGMSLNRALLLRRSIRQYNQEPLSLAELSQILWAAQGITKGEKLRTAPSAGATFPLETYVAVGNVTGLAPGIYHYEPRPHELTLLSEGDVRKALSDDCLGQTVIRDGAATVVLAAEFDRTSGRYGQRATMYVHQETGHVGQNVYLMATALGLATVAVGAFDETLVALTLGLPKKQIPLYLFPVGKPK
jgi:SagB-type dehydrogenase family enzyme